MVFYKEAYIIVTTLIKVLLCASKRIEVFYFHVFSAYRLKVRYNTSAKPMAAKHKMVFVVKSVNAYIMLLCVVSYVMEIKVEYFRIESISLFAH